jgi:hypothetical protein
MTFEKAKKEFEIRYYLWAISEWQKEIDESFPNLRKFKNGAFWETYQVMQQLNKSQQLTLAHGLLKRFHPEAVKSLGENCSREEESLRALASFISFSAWLGITSQIQWEYLTDEDVDPAYDAVIKHCRHFVDVLPKLLKGLECEKITLE